MDLKQAKCHAQKHKGIVCVSRCIEKNVAKKLTLQKIFFLSEMEDDVTESYVISQFAHSFCTILQISYLK